MKLLVVLISLTMTVGSLAFAKSPAKADGKRKPAESHGRVMRNNSEFQAVFLMASGEAGGSSRIHSIRKITDCRTSAGESLYVVNYGSLDSATGIESTDAKGETYVVKDFNWENETTKVEIYKGDDCKWGRNK